MRALAVAPLLAGCLGSTAVELELEMPEPSLGAQYAPGCTTAVEIYLNGGTYETDSGDYYRYCIPVAAPDGSWSDVHAAIRDRFEASFPETGLSSVEIYGYAGACDAPEETRYDHDLIFYGAGAYTGQDRLAIRTTPNLSCAMQEVRVRPIDILKLVATGQCSRAAWTQPGKLAASTLSPYWMMGTDWWGGQSGANVVDGVATFTARTKPGPDTCLAIGHYTGDWEAVSCIGPAEQRVCATGTEIEAPMLSRAVAIASRDGAKATPWGSLVIGAVWSTGPVAGATVTLDDASKALGEVVYFDLPSGVESGTGALTARTGTSTGPSGLFGVYTKSLVTLKITANGKTVTRKVGGHVGDTPDAHAALIKL